VHDPHTIRLVVGILGAILALCVVGQILLVALGHNTVDLLALVAGTAVGGITGILVPSGTTQRVHVANEADEPVPVEHTPGA
jgi:hypothetical protein